MTQQSHTEFSAEDIRHDAESTQEKPESTCENPEGTQEEPEAVRDPLEAAQEEIEALKDQLLRRAAEFDNYRKRVLREKTELIETGGKRVMEALLPVLDDLARAQQNMQSADDVDALREGVALIASKLLKALQGEGLQNIECVGMKFDTDFHEAVALVPATDDAQKGMVIDCVQTGYLLGGHVLRHAKVVVGQ